MYILRKTVLKPQSLATLTLSITYRLSIKQETIDLALINRFGQACQLNDETGCLIAINQ